MRRVEHLAALVALAGCGALDSVPSGAVTQCQQTAVLPGTVKTDILFVVDDSSSMTAKQTNLANNFGAFIDRLSASPVRNEFQIGITTTSVDEWFKNTTGDETIVTTFQSSRGGPNVGQPYPAGALVAIIPGTGGQYYPYGQGPRILAADSPTLATDFETNVAVGSSGSGKEQGLRAAKLALSDRIADGENQGFLRPGARLAVIIVSDDDDCSDPTNPPGVQLPSEGQNCEDGAEKLADFVSFLQGPVDGETRDVVVAAIASVDPVSKQPTVCEVQNPDGSLSGVYTEYQALRYNAFVGAFGSQGFINSVCNASFHDTLTAIAGLIDPGQTLPLEGAPADWRMLSVTLQKASGASVTCSTACTCSDPTKCVGTGDVASADAIYTCPEGGRPATLTFQGANCRLEQGDKVDLKLLCAG